MNARRTIAGLVGALALLGGLIFGAHWMVTDPGSPLPRQWNPLEPIHVTDPVTPLTGYKLRRALGDPQTCLATLAQTSDFTPMSPLVQGDNCGIENRVELRSAAGVALKPVETSCETALRLSLWVEHGLKPAASEIFRQVPARLHHIGSYNCRPIRGSTTRMSTHATASAIDIVGVRLSDGTSISLLRGWSGPSPQRRFFEMLRDTGCEWFQTVLGPEFNALHADHFHFQSRGWGTCR